MAQSNGDEPPREGAAPPVRRRGSLLESALLQATWDELKEVGYGALSMESVASRARTSRAVLYRRWPNRAELVLAALRRHASFDLSDIPDTGSLREDLLTLLRWLSKRADEFASVLSFLVAEYFQESGLTPARVRERALAGSPRMMTTILERAVARGEIDRARLSPRIAALPVDLVRHDLFMTQSPASEATLVEIVDRIFLPLVKP